LPEEEVTPMNCRYDGQIMVYGKTIQESLANMNIFVVGAGAIGCELLKNFALMGVACGTDPNKGMCYVTDMDIIEKSNLSRQFLFRNSDIGKYKSETSVVAAKAMNGAFKTLHYNMRVGADTENVFNDEFWASIDCVYPALDNVDARLYVDQRCVFYRKPMFESGTLGTKGHTNVFIPNMTEHYGAKRDPPEPSFAICTLKHFPHLIEHTLAWARDWYEEAYKQAFDDVNAYLDNENYFDTLEAQQNMKLDTLNRIKESLMDRRPSTYADCILWAREKFEDMFCNSIKQLLFNFPTDKMVSSDGGASVPFWSGTKKPPRALVFDIQDEIHMEFIVSNALLRAKAYNIEAPSGMDIYLEVLPTINVPQFTPKGDMKIPSNDEEAKTQASNDANITNSSSGADVDAKCREVMASFPSRSDVQASGFALTAMEFDKDDDMQMRIITATSNLRARNYAIPEQSFHQSKLIAGKITPAIATTTALVTGAICVELFKTLFNKTVEDMFNTYANLAIPIFTREEPNPPAYTVTTVKGEEWKWSVWDRIDITNSNMTLEELIAYMDSEYNAELSMLSAGVSILYSDFMERKKVAARKPMTLKSIAETVLKKEIPADQKFMIFEIICNDNETDDELELPCLRLCL